MAGDWIKMRIDLQSHPKVVRILSAIQRTEVQKVTDKFRVIGGLHAVWSVFDTHSVDGALQGYTPNLLDHIVGLNGISQAMIDVQWLGYDGAETLVMPEFAEHNGKSGKRRAEDQKRKREGRKCPQSVRNLSADDVEENRTREEKRREDKENTFVASVLDDLKQPACPHEKVIALYADALPMLPFPRVWEGQRQEMLRARWRWVLTNKKPTGEPYATDADTALDFFRRFFGYVAKCPHLVGENDRGWTADLAWLVKAENFAKVIEGKYEPKAVTA